MINNNYIIIYKFLGLGHEQSRQDRDEYVIVYYENMADGYFNRNNFFNCVVFICTINV